MEGHLGLGAPYGSLGVSVAGDFVRYLGVVAGVGLGFSGPQVAAGVRARLPLSAVAFGVEVTWSGGPYEAGLLHSSDRRTSHWDFAHWLNVAPSFEIRTEVGFSARVYGGYGELLNESDGECAGDEGWYSCPNGDALGFFAVALGNAF